jgi:hypothetical protein
LFLQAAGALTALASAPRAERETGALILAGEAAGALTRLACVLEEGSHPPSDLLAGAARETRLGRRIGSWLDDAAPSVSGDERAARWIRDSSTGVLREVAGALHAGFGNQEWLRDPSAFTLRPPR